MKAVVLMFDSLNRHMLGPYSPDSFVHAPNFQRLARRSVTFERSYVCSMPCMPARRDFHTARPHFLHTGWGPIEPYDDSVPQMLCEAGVYTHLASDHYHYWQDGGATYHGRYNSWEFFRGQEGDPFVGQVADPVIPDTLNNKTRRSDWVNRPFMQRDADHSQTKTFHAGLSFIERNHDQDNWMLQIECFDPHEPFFCHRQYKDLYPSDYDGPLFDWPAYRPVTETPEQVDEAKRNYAALVSKCDASLGDVLDAMDRHDMWRDTMLIVWTDHGFMLGEHDCWAKIWMPMYEEVAHTPFFVWDPRCACQGERRDALVQPALDLGPTLLGLFGLEPTGDMLGHDLRQTIAANTPVRETAIFGCHGQAVNVTDGRYVYMRRAATEDNKPLYSYTLMPTCMRGFPPGEQLVNAQLAGPFSFTKNQRVLKLDNQGAGQMRRDPTEGSVLYDVQNDPRQQAPLDEPGIERKMIEHLQQLMQQADAPAEQYVRLGLKSTVTAKT